MNIVECILKHHVDEDNIKEREYVLATIDFLYTNGLTLASSINEMKRIEKPHVFNTQKIGIFPDHFTPNKDIATANLERKVREWARKEKIKHYYEVGDVGIEHIQFIEKQLARPGDVVVGGDSHSCTLGAVGIFSLGVGTTDLTFAIQRGKIWIKVPEVINIEIVGTPRNELITGKDIILYILNKMDAELLHYKVIVFTGDGCKYLDLDDRISMCNMCVEGGAKTGIFVPSEDFLESIQYKNYDSQKLKEMQNTVKGEKKILVSLDDIDFQVAIPPSPRNGKSLSEIRRDKIKIDQVFIGSCTNGSIEDLRLAAKILDGKKRNSETRVIIIPATPHVYREALKEGLIDIFLEFGATIGPPSCGPCLGGHLGVIGDGEVCLSTSNRNFSGRMGSPSALVYLSSPVIAAFSAVNGYICGPEEQT